MPEKCTDYLNVLCPSGANCNGICQFRVCATYDTVPESTDIKNLKVAFEGRTAANPIVGDGGNAVSGCGFNFNNGRGFVEYTDNADKKKTLTTAKFNAEFRRVQAALTAQEQREFNRILAKGDCSKWTKEERDWVIRKTAPTLVDGWKIKWVCQGNEPGPVKLSVNELEINDTNPIKNFRLAFTIVVSCICGDASNRAILTARLSGP